MKAWRDHDWQLEPRERFNALVEQYIDTPLPAKDAETITKWYDALSRNYDELYGEEQNKKHAKVLELLGNREFKIIVDVGCGTGKLLGLISPRSRFGLGIDLSLQMLKRAKRRTTDSGVQLVRADASHLPLQDHIADGVTSVSMTESGSVFEEHFNELSRIATKDATLIMTIFDDKDRTSWKQLSETRIELVASLSDREQLYLLDRAKHRVRASSESSALV
ncbi:methyltransferase domain-containing protein [Candidatus Bathyarchaeota archaeon]|nr:MAG: methyltransferase domain-containing protein [Candidatus Bathyarchaeota archaeon]TMI44632.1 MAG: methyltransferase domain-containing protein [Candidatus Bathyarchaeota archaeon]